jgi:hypothetical protein
MRYVIIALSAPLALLLVFELWLTIGTPHEAALGLLWLLTMDVEGPLRLEALPLKLEYCRTELAQGDDADWIRGRFRSACAALGTEVKEESGFLVVELG